MVILRSPKKDRFFLSEVGMFEGYLKMPYYLVFGYLEPKDEIVIIPGEEIVVFYCSRGQPITVEKGGLRL